MGRKIVLCNYWSKLKHASESWKEREGKKNCMNLNKTLVEDSYRNIGYCNAFNFIYIYIYIYIKCVKLTNKRLGSKI